MEGLLELNVNLNIVARELHHWRSHSYLWEAGELEVVKLVTRPTRFRLTLPSELAGRVEDHITAPNLEILKSDDF